MNIFITGASGFLGSNFLNKIINNYSIEKIFCLCRTEIPINNKKVIIIKSDLKELYKLKINDKINIAIHFAAYLKYESKKMFELINVKGTQNIIEFCKLNDINKLIHCSSINVKLNKKGGYAKSKIKSEELVKNSGLSYIIARPTLIYGSHDNGLNKMINFAKKLGIIPIFGSGKYLQQPIYIDEATDYFEKLLFCEYKNICLELGGIEKITYLDMIRNIAEVLNKKVVPFKIPKFILLFGLSVFELLHIPFFIRKEQIYSNNENLICENNIDIVFFNVRRLKFKENIEKYILK